MSSYISPAPQGDPKATGAYAVAIAATASTTNNDGNALDSAGNVSVDFTWGNFPLQPNDVRTENVLSNFGGSTGDYGWAATTYATPARLDLNGTSAYSGSNVIANKSVKSIHEIAGTKYSGFPAFTAGVAKYIVTQVDGDGTTVTYQCQNFLTAGDTVTITGCDSFNLTGATVAKATRDYFTVTNSTTGSLVNVSGIAAVASGASASDGSYISGVAYLNVPNVIGNTTAVALDTLKDAGYATANITTASAATNSAKTVTAVSRTTGSTTIRFSASSHGYAVGNKVTVSGLASEFNATWTVSNVPNANQFDVVGTSTTSYGASGLSGSVVAVSGTIKAQNVAAGTASVAIGSAITITPWA